MSPCDFWKSFSLLTIAHRWPWDDIKVIARHCAAKEQYLCGLQEAIPCKYHDRLMLWNMWPQFRNLAASLPFALFCGRSLQTKLFCSCPQNVTGALSYKMNNTEQRNLCQLSSFINTTESYHSEDIYLFDTRSLTHIFLSNSIFEWLFQCLFMNKNHKNLLKVHILPGWMIIVHACMLLSW